MADVRAEEAALKELRFQREAESLNLINKRREEEAGRQRLTVTSWCIGVPVPTRDSLTSPDRAETWAFRSRSPTVELLRPMS